MKNLMSWMTLSVLLVGSFACAPNSIDVPGSVLAGLHKPVINRLSPQEVKLNDTGFYLTVSTQVLKDTSYTLYINNQQIGTARPDYWRITLGWMIPHEIITQLQKSNLTGPFFNVRISSIPVEYDISGAYDDYSEYVSDPIPLLIKKGTTRFTSPRRLFPEWVNSQDPIIRCDSSGRLYLAWREKIGDVYQAFFSHSADNGQTWSQVLNVSRSQRSIGDFDIEADGRGEVYLVWNEQVYEGNNMIASYVIFCRSRDYGLSWDPVWGMNRPEELADCPDLSIDDLGTIRMVWNIVENGRVKKLRLLHSEDDGSYWPSQTFSVPEMINNNEPILVSGTGGFLCLVAGETSYWTKDSGATWNSDRIQEADRNLASARMGPQGQLFLVWGYSQFAGHMFFNNNFFMRRESAGDWGEPQRLDENCRTTDDKTALSLRTEGVDVVLTSPGGLFLLRSSDDGRHWSIPEFIPGADGVPYCSEPDTVYLPSGTTTLVFVRSAGAGAGIESHLYLMQFE